MSQRCVVCELLRDADDDIFCPRYDMCLWCNYLVVHYKNLDAKRLSDEQKSNIAVESLQSRLGYEIQGLHV